jgi:hypothetical protein
MRKFIFYGLTVFLAYFPYFEKIKWAYEITLLCVCLCIPLIVARERFGKIPYLC